MNKFGGIFYGVIPIKNTTKLSLVEMLRKHEKYLLAPPQNSNRLHTATTV